MKATKPWRRELEPYVAEICDMVKHLREVSPEHDRDDLERREFRAAWRIFSTRHLISTYDRYPYVMFRDAIARNMGRLRGRVGRAHDEHVRQRRLESAGQQRLLFAAPEASP